ncbi:MAG: AAA family ATPase [Clostridia bacterium]|nr:AAA family ATPase [Clostridia bacterium]
MGIYLNPGNGLFQQALNSEIYVDKSMLIKTTNRNSFTEQKYICVSRPRRFGKSINLGMLAAYYSCGCDSKEMFDALAISKDESYLKHLNKYNVIYINMQRFLSNSKNIDDMLLLLQKRLIKDFKKELPDIDIDADDGLSFCLSDIYAETNKLFVILIDEWDCVMREHQNNKEAQKTYLDFLRDLLKDNDFVALAYMTGILPIKKYGTHSALNMFREFSMLNSSELNEYIGFTNSEVKTLCQRFDVDFEEMRAWYDGYKLNDTELYCPNSVVRALEEKTFAGYWTETETYEALAVYIAMNYDGLHDTIQKMLAGQNQPVDTRTFSNDMVTFANKDDILTLLIHLGYLGYDKENKTAYIPNKEIADEFVVSMKATGLWKETIETVTKSRQLLTDTLKGKSEKVAESIQKIHSQNSSIINYNNEQSLRFIILIAYYYAKEQYTIIQEMPSGEGFADIMFIPKLKVDSTAYPPMVIELKWDHSSDTAIEQIKNRKYFEALESFDKVLLVGISYEKGGKGHQCTIEEHKINERN